VRMHKPAVAAVVAAVSAAAAASVVAACKVNLGASREFYASCGA